MLVSECGALIRYLVTGGEVNDVTQGTLLVSKEVNGTEVVGDRAYDSNAFVAYLERRGFEAVIPSRASRLVSRTLNSEVYQRRNVIERWFGRMKQFRRIATRYEKTVCSYEGFIALGSMVVAVSGWTV